MHHESPSRSLVGDLTVIAALMSASLSLGCGGSPISSTVATPIAVRNVEDNATQFTVEGRDIAEYQGCEPHYRSVVNSEVFLKHVEKVTRPAHAGAMTETTVDLHLDHPKTFRKLNNDAFPATPGFWRLKLVYKHNATAKFVSLETATLIGPFVDAGSSAPPVVPRTDIAFSNLFSTPEDDLTKFEEYLTITEIAVGPGERRRLVGMGITALGNTAAIYFQP